MSQGKLGKQPTIKEQTGRPTHHHRTHMKANPTLQNRHEGQPTTTAYQPSQGHREANPLSLGIQGQENHHIICIRDKIKVTRCVTKPRQCVLSHNTRPDMTLAMNPGRAITEYISCPCNPFCTNHTLPSNLFQSFLKSVISQMFCGNHFLESSHSGL